jgi:hypothetical protein
MKKSQTEKDDDEQPYDSMSDPDIETDEKPLPVAAPKVPIPHPFGMCSIVPSFCLLIFVCAAYRRPVFPKRPFLKRLFLHASTSRTR